MDLKRLLKQDKQSAAGLRGYLELRIDKEKNALYAGVWRVIDLRIKVKNGGGAGIRTPDTANMSRMLYHLSYTAMLKTMLNKVKKNSN